MHLHCLYHVYHSAGRESRFFSWKLVIFRSNPSLSRPSSWEVWSWCCSHWNGWWAKLSWMLKAAFLGGQDVHDPKIIFPTCKFVECSQVWNEDLNTSCSLESSQVARKSQALDFDGMLLCCKPRISNVFTCTSLEAWETNALAHPLDITIYVVLKSWTCSGRLTGNDRQHRGVRKGGIMVDTEAAFAVMFGATRSRGQHRLK